MEKRNLLSTKTVRVECPQADGNSASRDPLVMFVSPIQGKGGKKGEGKK